MADTIVAPFEFSICSWSAWAPGILLQQDWCDFFGGKKQITPDEKAEVDFLSAMQRRRLSPLARAVFHVIEKITPAEDDSCASVFCSSYGETQRTFGILDNIAHGEEVSPTAFSLSVHNAISGQYSIFFGNTCPSVALSANERNYLIGFSESIGQIIEGQKQVLLVFYEDPLPELYKRYARSVDFPCALALLIGRYREEDEVSSRYHLSFSRNDSFIDDVGERPLLQLIEFLCGDQKTLILGDWVMNRS